MKKYLLSIFSLIFVFTSIAQSNGTVTETFSYGDVIITLSFSNTGQASGGVVHKPGFSAVSLTNQNVLYTGFDEYGGYHGYQVSWTESIGGGGGFHWHQFGNFYMFDKHRYEEDTDDDNLNNN